MRYVIDFTEIFDGTRVDPRVDRKVEQERVKYQQYEKIAQVRATQYTKRKSGLIGARDITVYRDGT